MRSSIFESRIASPESRPDASFGSRIPDPDSRPDACLDSLNDALEQRNERAADPPTGRNHVVMNDWMSPQAGGRIGNARDAKDLHTHVARRDCFGYRRHADRVGTQLPKEIDFRRCFVA